MIALGIPKREGEVADDDGEAAEWSDQRGNCHLREHRKDRPGDHLPSDHRAAQSRRKKFGGGGVGANGHHGRGNLEPTIRDGEPQERIG